MKHFKCTFLKVQSIATMKKEPAQLVEQEYITDKPELLIVTPAGFTLLSVIEYLPQINQCDENTLKKVN